MVRKEKGFTLLELLIVVIIIGILASMALPQYNKIIVRARTAEALTNLSALRSSMQRYWYDHVVMGDAYVVYPLTVITLDADIALLDIDDPNDTANRKWVYGIDDDSTSDVVDYVIEAQLLVNNALVPTTWIQIDEEGNINKSNTLGGANARIRDLDDL